MALVSAMSGADGVGESPQGTQSVCEPKKKRVKTCASQLTHPPVRIDDKPKKAKKWSDDDTVDYDTPPDHALLPSFDAAASQEKKVEDDEEIAPRGADGAESRVFEVGEAVSARFGRGWYDGVVDEVLVNGDGRVTKYEVLWTTGECNPIRARDVRARGGSGDGGDEAKEYVGVWVRGNKGPDRFCARIQRDGKMNNLGTFPTAEAAARAFDASARQLGRPVNFPRQGEQKAKLQVQKAAQGSNVKHQPSQEDEGCKGWAKKLFMSGIGTNEKIEITFQFYGKHDKDKFRLKDFAGSCPKLVEHFKKELDLSPGTATEHLVYALTQKEGTAGVALLNGKSFTNFIESAIHPSSFTEKEHLSSSTETALADARREIVELRAQLKCMTSFKDELLAKLHPSVPAPTRAMQASLRR